MPPIAETVFLVSVASAAAIFGFSATLATARKQDPNHFSKGLTGHHLKELPESGGRLAVRALGYGTLYAVTGFSAFCWLVWKMSGAKDVRNATRHSY